MDEKNQKIRDAIELVEEAQRLIEETLEGTEEMNTYRAYGRHGFDQLLGNGNKYDRSLCDLLDGGL